MVVRAAGRHAEAAPTRIADCHVHLRSDAEIGALVRAAEHHGLTRMLISSLGIGGFIQYPDPGEFRQANLLVARARSTHPELIDGYVYVNPLHEREALSELRTRVEDHGFCGLKLWRACYCDEPTVFPLIEQMIAYGLPILIDSWVATPGILYNQPCHVAALASRYPEAKIIMAHLGADWVVALRPIRRCANVCVDPSGIDPEDGQIETAIAEVGARRLIFGSDFPGRDLASQIAKVLGADIDAETREMVLWGNCERLFRGKESDQHPVPSE